LVDNGYLQITVSEDSDSDDDEVGTDITTEVPDNLVFLQFSDLWKAEYDAGELTVEEIIADLNQTTSIFSDVTNWFT
jgi:hypothetical protein